MLQPLSVRDAIWIEVERHRTFKEKMEYEESKLKFLDGSLDNIHLALLDIRDILVNTNVYQQIAAMANTKRPKLHPIKDDDLPSRVIRRKREWDALPEEEKRRREDEKRKRQIDHYRNVMLAQQIERQSREEHLRHLEEENKAKRQEEDSNAANPPDKPPEEPKKRRRTPQT